MILAVTQIQNLSWRFWDYATRNLSMTMGYANFVEESGYVSMITWIMHYLNIAQFDSCFFCYFYQYFADTKINNIIYVYSVTLKCREIYYAILHTINKLAIKSG